MNMNSYVEKKGMVVANDTDKLYQYLKILGDKSKYSIVKNLMDGEICVCDLAEHIGMEQTLMSHHLRTLRAAGLVRSRKVGKWIHYSLDKDAMNEVNVLLQAFLSEKNISDKTCDSHDICCQVTKEEL